MAPFRSSRTTRNFDPNQAPRVRGGAIDHDPTEGLPVQQYSLDPVIIKQDITSNDTEDSNQQDKGDAFPWPEHPLPSFFHQLQPHSQEILRRARMGNRPTVISVYDKKTETYSLPNTNAPKTKTTVKSKRTTTSTNGITSPAAATVAADEGEDDENDNAEDDEMTASDVEIEKLQNARIAAQKLERTFTSYKWNTIPAETAEKMPERRFLAARRPGMRSLYDNYGYGGTGIPGATMIGGGVGDGGTASTGFDLGDGSGLSNALGGAGAGAGTPNRPGRSMPPKRKKKKGGPGRRKVVKVEVNAGEEGQGDGGEVAALLKKDGEGDGAEKEENENENESGSESEGEGDGSEEGEIEEEIKDDKAIIAEEKSAETPVADVAVEEAKKLDVEEGEEDLLGSLDAAVDKDMENAA